MSAAVVTWLASDEGQQWAESAFGPDRMPVSAGRWLAPAGVWSPLHQMHGPVDPRHDPCGRPAAGRPS